MDNESKLKCPKCGSENIKIEIVPKAMLSKTKIKTCLCQNCGHDWTLELEKDIQKRIKKEKEDADANRAVGGCLLFFAFLLFPPIGIPLFLILVKNPSKKIKIIISASWAIIWLILVMAINQSSYRYYEINGNKVRISCLCSAIEGYGDDNALRVLAEMGIRDISSAPSSLDAGTTANVVAKNEVGEERKITFAYKDNKLTKVYSTEYPQVVFYSTNTKDTTVAFPGTKEIAPLEAKKQQDEQRTAYEVIESWDIPNGGKTKKILISRDNLNDAYMTNLGEKLRQDTSNERNSFVQVYTDIRAAALRDKLLTGDLTKAEEDLYDKHFVGFYVKNANNGTHYFNIFFNGTSGDNQKIIRY